MDKKADRYLDVLPWQLREQGFHADHGQVSESLFALGNEYMGVRGYFDEDYSGSHLQGSYFNGLYDYSQEPPVASYRGVVTKQHFMVNAADWLTTHLWADGELLDLAQVEFTDFCRELDFREGELRRSFVWTLTSGKKIQVEFARFLDMTEVTAGYQQITLTALDPDRPVAVRVDLGIDLATKYGNGRYQYWRQTAVSAATEPFNYLVGETVTTKQKLASGFRLFCNQSEAKVTRFNQDQATYCRVEQTLVAGQPLVLDKEVINLIDRDAGATAAIAQRLQTRLQDLNASRYQTALAAQRRYWQQVWAKVDIKINGDDQNQQGIRFCIFQLEQTYHGQSPTDNIGAKGLTGEAYNGHTFWDTEACCLPFYLFNNLAAAKSLLGYRYDRLPQARARARELDCVGACYPIATLNGDEASNLWQHASTQFQPSTAVAYGIFHYLNLTQDEDFLLEKGLEMLLEISRFLYSRGDYGQESGKFGFYGVMGPDEFQVMVNHNMYTNIMAQETFRYTLAMYQQLQATHSDQVALLAAKIGLKPQELSDWQTAADKMMILQTETGLFEQHQGFFDLPHLDISQIPNEDFPLYNHWSYDHLFRNDMIKQADVLMFLFLLNSQYSTAVKEINYDYYEPRTIHESSLSPAIHSILAAELHKYTDATKMFEFATRLDLDNYNRNTNEGLHTTSLASAWLNIVYGFGGLRSDGPILSLQPTLPAKWHDYEFHIQYQQVVLTVKVAQEVTMQTAGGQVALKLYGQEVTIDEQPQHFAIPASFQE